MKKIMHSFWKLIIVLVLGIGAISVAAGTLKTEAETPEKPTGGGTTTVSEPEDLSAINWNDANKVHTVTVGFVADTATEEQKQQSFEYWFTNNPTATDKKIFITLGGDIEVGDSDKNVDWIKIQPDSHVYVNLNGHKLVLNKKLCTSDAATSADSSIVFTDTSKGSDQKPQGLIDATQASNPVPYLFEVNAADSNNKKSDLRLDHINVLTKKRVINGIRKGNIYITDCNINSLTDKNSVNETFGGAIYAENKNIIISNSTINGFHTQNEGGAIVLKGTDSTVADLKIYNSTISNNSSNKNAGGAIFLDNSNLTIGENTDDQTMISDNTSNVGGAVYAGGSNYTFTMNGGTIDNNKAESTDQGAGGGGFRIAGHGHFIMNGGLFTRNRSNAGGGAIKIGNYESSDNVIADFHNGTFGGDDTKTLDETQKVYANSSHNEGGAIWLGANVYGYIGPRNDNDQLNISYNKVDDYKDDNDSGLGPTTDWGGGGVFVADGGTLKIEKAVVEGNHAVGFGGGVAGCSTGRIVINPKTNTSNISKNGIAIFGNTADGDIEHGLSGGTSAKHDDHVIAKGNTVFLNNGYQDYFCALDSSVNEDMLGGGSEHYKGSYDSKKIEDHDETDKQVFNATQIMGLTSQASESAQENARKAEHVHITYNSSGTHGGGILCNGIMIMGDNPDSLTFNDRLIVQGLKGIEDGNYDPQHPFTFELDDSDGNEVAKKNTTKYKPSDNAKTSIQNIANFENKEIIEITIPYSDIKEDELEANNKIKDRTYYLYEINNSLEYATNTTAYEIKITGKQYKQNPKNNKLIDVKINDGNGDNTIPSLNWTADQIDDVSVRQGTIVNDVFTPGENKGNYDEHFAKKLDTGLENGKDQYNHAKYLWLGINGVENGENNVPLTEGKVNADIYTANNQNRKGSGSSTAPATDHTTDFVGGKNASWGIRDLDDNTNYGDNPSQQAGTSDWTVNLEDAFTNKKVTSYSVEKIWNDADNADGKRPENVNVMLYKKSDDKQYDNEKVALNTDNNWTHTWEGLPFNDEYYVKELKGNKALDNNTEFIEGEDGKDGYTVTYTDVKNLEVNAYNNPANGVKVGLFTGTTAAEKPVLDANNNPVIVTLNAGNNWTDTFKNLDASDPNNHYFAKAINDDGSIIDTTSGTGYLYELSSFEFDGKVITNTHNQELTSVGVTKKWMPETSGVGKQVTLDLYADGVKQNDKSITLDGTVDPFEDKPWHALWTNLPKNKWENGESKEIKYTVQEATSLPDYIVSYRDENNKKLKDDHNYATDGQYIYNTNLIDFTVTKRWEDNDNSAGKRPDRIRVRLNTGEKGKYKEAELSDQNQWTYTWKNLPEVDDYGNRISYMAEETDLNRYYVPSYETSGNSEIITNIYTEEKPGEVKLTIHKTFKGDPVPDQNKKNLKFRVTGIGKKTDENGNVTDVKVDETVSYASFSNGSYTFYHLYPGEYTVKETNSGVKGYQVSVKYVVNGKTSQKVNAAEADHEYKIDITDEYHKDAEKKKSVDTSDHTNLPWSAGILGISMLIGITALIFRKRYN